MASALLGVVLDSSVLIAAERRTLTVGETVETVRRAIGEVPLILCALTVAEVGHGIYRARSADMRNVAVYSWTI